MVGSPANGFEYRRARATSPAESCSRPTYDGAAGSGATGGPQGKEQEGKEEEETDNPLPRLRRSERSERRAKRGGESPWAVDHRRLHAGRR